MRGTRTERKLAKAAHEAARERVEAWSGTKPSQRDVKGFFFGGVAARVMGRLAGRRAALAARRKGYQRLGASVAGKAGKKGGTRVVGGPRTKSSRGSFNFRRSGARRASKPPGAFKQSLYTAGAFTAVDYGMRKLMGDDQQADFGSAGYGDQRDDEDVDRHRPPAPTVDYRGLAGSRAQLGGMAGPIKYPIA